MPRADEHAESIWTSTDSAFALRELCDEFPRHSTDAIIAAIQVAERILPSTSGRVKLVQVAREQVRAL